MRFERLFSRCRYSTFLVKYSWCFLSLGFVICLSLGAYAVLFRDLPDFNDPTKVPFSSSSTSTSIDEDIFLSLQGFVPRGKHTLTSRLFVLSHVKNEIERQLIEAKVIVNKDRVSSTVGPDSLSYVDPEDENDEDDEQDDGSFDVKTLREDFDANTNECAFSTTNSSRCLTNGDVFQLIDNRSDLMKVSKSIEQQIHKANEQICTSIDLSAFPSC